MCIGFDGKKNLLRQNQSPSSLKETITVVQFPGDSYLKHFSALTNKSTSIAIGLFNVLEQFNSTYSLKAYSHQDPDEEINTRELAKEISSELKRFNIPQAVFAQRVLCRSQGTLSDLLRNPKPWSKLKSGRETFKRMQNWLRQPEHERVTSLKQAIAMATQFRRRQISCPVTGLEHFVTDPDYANMGPRNAATNRKPRLVFTDIQRRTLYAIFMETKRPSKEMQTQIAEQLGLEVATVANFFMNARRRSLEKWQEEEQLPSKMPNCMDFDNYYQPEEIYLASENPEDLSCHSRKRDTFDPSTEDHNTPHKIALTTQVRGIVKK
ncbi:Hepatocyte nuclear factor 6 [Cichlidogyrus casuarinus]|uniref:One cut domain family member n=1 Tax=Cichlidogyrus casuarinus TaxID=1844966 RepID=A0ABD2PLA0_9PLAT